MRYHEQISRFKKWQKDPASSGIDGLSINFDQDIPALCLKCPADRILEVASILQEGRPVFASLVVEEDGGDWNLGYFFYGDSNEGLIRLGTSVPKNRPQLSSLSHLLHAVDWHEREVEDLFGLVFEGHPGLGDFVLHEEWPEGINPMKQGFDALTPYPHREVSPRWRPVSLVRARGAFMMPIGPVYSDYAESAHFLLETVGEDVIRTIVRLFYKYRGVEKIAQTRTVSEALLLSERFTGTSAFAHSLAFCQAIERLWKCKVPDRAVALRTFMAEIERFRHHVAAVAAIAASTGLGVATSQAAIMEEELLRLSCRLTGHRYLFGLNLPGGLSLDISDPDLRGAVREAREVLQRFQDLRRLLTYTSSFLDRIEQVGTVSRECARTTGLVGPVARASGIVKDIRKVLPYALYKDLEFACPNEKEGDGYARLRILFDECKESVKILDSIAGRLPGGPVRTKQMEPRPGAAMGWVEAPIGAAFHWVRTGKDGRIERYRISPPSFLNWHGFHLAAERFAFQDFPIILATFGLSVAESDR